MVHGKVSGGLDGVRVLKGWFQSRDEVEAGSETKAKGWFSRSEARSREEDEVGGGSGPMR